MPAPVPRRPSPPARRSATRVVPLTAQRLAAAGAAMCLLLLGWATWHAVTTGRELTAAIEAPLLAQLELGPAQDPAQEPDRAAPPPAPELPDGPTDSPPAPANSDVSDPKSTVEDEQGGGSANYVDQPSNELQSQSERAEPGAGLGAAPEGSPDKTRPQSNRTPNPARSRADRPQESGSAAGGPQPDSRGSSGPAAGATSETEPHKLAPPPTAPRQLSPRQQALKQQLEQCLQFYFVNKPLNTRDDSAWSIMHSFLGFGAPTPVAVGSPQGQRANAIAWMCANKPCGGRELLYVQNGLVIGREGPGYQGHPAQFLAMLAQVHVSPGYELRVANQRLTVEALIESEKVTCRDGMELTFKLISLSHYLPSTATWQNRQGQAWDIPRLIRAEISQPINGAACGGTHRLMGLSCAIYNRQQEGLAIDGQWARADKYIRDYHRYTFSLQNPDGSFSSDWFKRRANWGENDRKLQTTGHIAEWMIYSVPEDELHDQRLFRAVQLLVNLMSQNRHYDWAVGPRGHAIRALRLYHERALGGRPADWMGGQMTRRSVSRSR